MRRLKRFIARTGLRSPNVLQAGDEPVLTACYRHNPRQFTGEVPLSLLRAWGPTGFRADDLTGNPFVATAARLAQEEAESGDLPLAAYYERFTPQSAGEALGLASSHPDSRIHRLPPAAYVYPWDSGNPQKEYNRRRASVRGEHRRAGGDPPVSNRTADDRSGSGHPHWGPADAMFRAAECRRLSGIVRSIAREGFHDTLENTLGAQCVLVHRGEYRVVIRKGNHRLAALAALGYTHARVRFGERQPLVVHREDCAHWPNVVSELFTADEACAVFDRLFGGQPGI